MKTLLIVSLLVLQTSASFFDVFAPVENSFGKLITDVVTDIKDTIDCTIYAVERVFSLGGLFGQRSSNYDERCKEHKEEETVESVQSSSYSEETSTEKPQVKNAKEILSQEIDNSVSNVSQQIKTILEQSQAQKKIENVKHSLKNETDRLTKISVILSQELSKIPENVRTKFEFKQDRPSLENVLNEVKLLYEVVQKNKDSAEANEVRHVFCEVLNVLHANGTKNALSDEDEVKKIIENLGKISNASLVDVENQVSQWTEEQNKQIVDIKNVVIIMKNDTPTTLSEIAHSDGKIQLDKGESNNIIHKNIDEIEKGQTKLVGFSRSLTHLSKSILNNVNMTDSLHNDTIKIPTEHIKRSTIQLLSQEVAKVSVSTTDTPQVIEQTTAVSQQPKIEINISATQSPQTMEQTTVSDEGITSPTESSENLELAKASFVESSSESSGSITPSKLEQTHGSDGVISQPNNTTDIISSPSKVEQKTAFSVQSSAQHVKDMNIVKETTSDAAEVFQSKSEVVISTTLSSLTVEQTTVSVESWSHSADATSISTMPSRGITKQITASYAASSLQPVNYTISMIQSNEQTTSQVSVASYPENNFNISTTSPVFELEKTRSSAKLSSQVTDVASISTTQSVQATENTTASSQSENPVDIYYSSSSLTTASTKSSSEDVNDVTLSTTTEQSTDPNNANSKQPNEVVISTSPLLLLMKQSVHDDARDTQSPQTIKSTANVSLFSQPKNNVVFSNISPPILTHKQTSISVESSSQAVNLANISTTQLSQKTNQKIVSKATAALSQPNIETNISTLTKEQTVFLSVPTSTAFSPLAEKRTTDFAKTSPQSLSAGSISPKQSLKTNEETKFPVFTVTQGPDTLISPLPVIMKQTTVPSVKPSSVTDTNISAIRLPQAIERTNIVTSNENYKAGISQSRYVVKQTSVVKHNMPTTQSHQILDRSTVPPAMESNRDIYTSTQQTPRSTLPNTQAHPVMMQALQPSVQTDVPLVPALLRTQTSGTELRVTTPSNSPDAQNVLPPSTLPLVPKTFQDVAKNIFAETSSSASQPDRELSQSSFDQFDDEEDLFADDDDDEQSADAGKSSPSLINKLFAPQDHESQKAAVENAKSIIDQSKQSNAIMNNLFKNVDHAAASSALENLAFFNFDTK